MKTILITVIILLLTACTADVQELSIGKLELKKNDQHRTLEYTVDHMIRFANDENKHIENYNTLKEEIMKSFEGVPPNRWGEFFDDVITNINTEEKVVALTFDACDGSSDSFDEKLIRFLTKEEIPATLFIAGQWIETNHEVFMELSNNPLFEIENHGYDHKPLSVTGARAYNIKGTTSVEEVFDEVYKNQLLIYELTGEYPKYFRSGTAYYDDVAVGILGKLGIKAVNYNVLGDAGGTFTKEQIINAFTSADEGAIFLFHMNRPNSDIAEGVKEGVQLLIDRGYSFVQLQEYDEQLQ